MTTSDAPTPAGSAFMPTLLTVFRIAMGPVIAGLVLWAASLVYVDRVLAGFLYALCVVLFALASATDWLDGWLARRLNAVTPLGAALDHTADKVLLTCVLVALAYAALPLPLVAAVVLLLGRDVAIGGLREGLSAQGRTLPVSQLGKWKTAAEMGGVGLYLAFQAAALTQQSDMLTLGLDFAARTLIWVAVLLALWSGARYAAAAFKPD